MLHFCEDRAVIGTPFYVMERVAGRVFEDNALPDLPREERAAFFNAMADTLAGLHAQDVAALGLADFGRGAISLRARSPPGAASTPRCACPNAPILIV
jgi:aminoglycoside phosphotransferase (APT) family kinase protein